MNEHVSLIIFWMLFSILHSLLASEWCKTRMRRLLGSSFRFYRFGYSVFATISLAAILSFQFTMSTLFLWQPAVLVFYIGVLVAATGLAIMMLCMRKYLLAITGVRVFLNKVQSAPVLQTSGLHRFTRHPLYLGTLLFIWGIFLISPRASNLICCMAMSIYTIAGIVFEEKKLVIQFGEDYTRYASEVPRLMPRFSARRAKSSPASNGLN